MKGRKILFINQEITPYVAENEMSLIGRNLPRIMQERGCEIRTFMPKWGGINERRGQLHEVIRLSRMMLIINDMDHPLIIKVASIPVARVQVYFTDNDDYFGKEQPASGSVGDDGTENGERAVFFARGVLETVKKLRWIPDIIHCSGWIGGIVPLYVKTAYKDEPSFTSAKVITSLYGGLPQGSLGGDFKKCVEFRSAKAKLLGKYKQPFSYEELEKLAIDYSDGIVTVGNIGGELAEYAAEKGLPVMRHEEDDNTGGAYEAFYERVLGV